ncbi:hypothetical protein [Lentzea flaviverrucosa]|uniref:Uncharacterized protein n=1 Tax=Lentzea flaviverrucosa TaxID=200379 RepID=A0A1H9CM90_9PSEU|nr:hypothetical protein [Lentzea flaviverrucosa]RDI24577.1 hypothetical protein DFR72_109157 [Lentzea flaviverrucosa]SEQ01793.1 hypothetical protein SAMN05216195_101812 [Lentzea flaviverrucosa]
MKRTRAVLPCLVVLATLVATPQASAATCTYVKQDLPVPAGVSNVYLNGGSSNNSRIAGHVQDGEFTRGAYWVNSTLRQLPQPSTGADNVFTIDVNNSSVVVGFEQELGSQPSTLRAFRFENGAYEYLETDQGKNSLAQAVNNAGDVAGTQQDGGVYLWPRNGARKLIAADGGSVIGITDGGKIVARGSSGVLVHDTNGGPTVQIPGGGAGTATFDNDRVFLTERLASGEREIAEYDLNGTKIVSHPGAQRAFGRNGSGTLWGTYITPGTNTQVHGLWRPAGRTDVVADPMPLISTYSDITDAATLIGTYRTTGDVVRPARWLWVCS